MIRSSKLKIFSHNQVAKEEENYEKKFCFVITKNGSLKKQHLLERGREAPWKPS